MRSSALAIALGVSLAAAVVAAVAGSPALAAPPLASKPAPALGPAEAVVLKRAAACMAHPVCRVAAEEALKRAGQRLIKCFGDTLDDLIDRAIDALCCDRAAAVRAIDAVAAEARRRGATDPALEQDLQSARTALISFGG